MSARCAWWRWLSPSLVLATSSTLVIALAFVRDVADTLRRAQLLQRASARMQAELVGDAVAMQHAAGEIASGQVVEMGGITCHLDERPEDWLIVAQDAEGAEHRFNCDALDGAAPAAFGSSAMVVDRALLSWLGVGRVAEREQLPRLDRVALGRAVRADQMPGFRRDQSVALLCLEAGTDGDDYVWSDGPKRSEFVVPGDLLVVPGHLWIEPGAEPLEINLPRDLVVVVQGNLYLGRSLTVRGRGRLLFATDIPPGTVAFADRDGNGRWSIGDAVRTAAEFHGAVEGGGSVYLGYGRKARPLDVDAGIVVAGELHMATDAVVRGPLVVPFSITMIGGVQHTIEATGSRRFQVERERVPGFVTLGAPRPSLLRRLEDQASKMAEQPLYLPSPLR